MGTKDDITPSGLKIEGAWENDRSSENSQLFKDIIREVFGVSDVIVGHHLVYEVRDKRPDGFTYEVVQEIPSADALIFDHAVALKLWGNEYQNILVLLVKEPAETRDALLGSLFKVREQIRQRGFIPSMLKK